jgi:glycine cleavage system H protein
VVDSDGQVRRRLHVDLYQTVMERVASGCRTAHAGDAVNPDDRRYTDEHEWARVDGRRLTVGITEYAQDALGDVVYIDLPATGTRVEKGQPFGEVESTKSVSDLYAPVTGTIVERNESLESNPELVNSDPYGDGWMVVIEAEDEGGGEDLLSAAEYDKLIESS